MKTILYLIYNAGNGGSEKYVRDLIRYSEANGYSCILGYTIYGKLVEDLESLGYRCINIKMNSILDIKAVLKIRSIVKSKNIDIVHAQFSRENYLACMATIFMRDVRVIFTNHMIFSENKFRYFTNKIISNFNYRIVAVSKASKLKMKENGFDEKKIDVIYNGIDLDSDINIDYKKNNFRLENSISKDSFVIINVSRFSQEKGILYLLDMYKNFLKEYNISDSKLVLVGSGELEDIVLKKIDDLKIADMVVLTGYMLNPEIAISESDLYINSSSNENFSFSIIEAMKHALPIIATNVGGNPELVNDSINNGFLIDFGSENMVHEIYKIYSDSNLASTLGQNSRKYVEDNLNISIMMKKTVDLYK